MAAVRLYPRNVVSSGITKRYEFGTLDGHMVKAAYVHRPEKHIICLSTQVGCVGECKFCSACNIPFKRNLTGVEMASMVERICFDNVVNKPLISFMGTGEPLSNLDNVLHTIQLIGGSVRFSLSTSGCELNQVGRIPIHVKVQFTLVSAQQGVRILLQPHSESLWELGQVAHDYRGPKEFNVPLIAGWNDTHFSMGQIARFVRVFGNLPVKLNQFHSMNGYEGSDRAEECLTILRRLGVKVEYYETDGVDINAACGQFELP